MQRFFGALAGLTLTAAVAAAPAQAQNAADARAVRFGVQAGLSMPTGDFGDGANMGFLVGGTLDLRPAALPVYFRADLAYQRWGLDDEAFGGLDVDGNASQISLAGNVVFPFPTEGMARPYVLGGLGIYRSTISAEFLGEEQDESETDLGFQLGGGVQFRLSGFDTYIEARYHDVADASFIPIVFGLKF